MNTVNNISAKRIKSLKMHGIHYAVSKGIVYGIERVYNTRTKQYETEETDVTNMSSKKFTEYLGY